VEAEGVTDCLAEEFSGNLDTFSPHSKQGLWL
jgi:hypothetical protein